MTLTSGTRLGAYEIAALIGVGGMGEVYRARDTRLNRDVALKVLPEAFAGDPDRLARFKREAQVLASLNHPNIAAIYGIEEGPAAFDAAQAGKAGHDGRWLAYASDESGRDEVYVQPYPGPGGKVIISTGGGRSPRWSADGRELFYRDGKRMMAVAMTTSPALRAGIPRLLFEGDFLPESDTNGSSNYDLAADGRFLMTRLVAAGPGSEAPRPQINIVLNWIEELKRLAPAK